MQHTITLTGQAPLHFKGDLIAKVDGERMTGKEQTRWHELAVYRTDGGKYVLAITYRTRWRGELDHEQATILDGPDEVAGELRDYIDGFLASHRIGFPSGASYADRQAALLRDLRAHYNQLVSDLLASDPAFAETVE